MKKYTLMLALFTMTSMFSFAIFTSYQCFASLSLGMLSVSAQSMPTSLQPVRVDHELPSKGPFTQLELDELVARERITEIISETVFWSSMLKNECQVFIGQLQGKSLRKADDYWFWQSTNDRLEATINSLKEYTKANGIVLTEIDECSKDLNSSFLCDKDLWQDFIGSFIVSAYGLSALYDASITNPYAWELLYVRVAIFEDAIPVLRGALDKLPSEHLLQINLRGCLAIFEDTRDSVEWMLQDFSFLPSMNEIDAMVG